MRKVRKDKGIPQLSERDRYLLSWVGEQYAVRADTLQKLLGRMPGKSQNIPVEEGKISIRNVRRVINRWETIGVACYQKFYHSQPGWVWLSTAGLRTQGLPYAPFSPRQGTDLTHLYYLNEVRLNLEEKYTVRLLWESERGLKKQAGEEKNPHVPDGVVTIDGNRVAVEVELTPKSDKRTKEAIQELLKHYPGVWYFVTDVTAPVIERAAGHSERVRLYPLKAVVGSQPTYVTSTRH